MTCEPERDPTASELIELREDVERLTRVMETVLYIRIDSHAEAHLWATIRLMRQLLQTALGLGPESITNDDVDAYRKRKHDEVLAERQRLGHVD